MNQTYICLNYGKQIKMVLIRQEEALKKFHITDDPDNYYLARAVDEGQLHDGCMYSICCYVDQV